MEFLDARCRKVSYWSCNKDFTRRIKSRYQPASRDLLALAVSPPNPPPASGVSTKGICRLWFVKHLTVLKCSIFLEPWPLTERDSKSSRDHSSCCFKSSCHRNAKNGKLLSDSWGGTWNHWTDSHQIFNNDCRWFWLRRRTTAAVNDIIQ